MIEAGDGGFPLSFSSSEPSGYRLDNGAFIQGKEPGFFDDHNVFYPHIDGTYDDQARFQEFHPGYTDDFGQFHEFSDMYLTSFLYQELHGNYPINQLGPASTTEPINFNSIADHPYSFRSPVNPQVEPNWEYEAQKLEKVTWIKYGLGRPQDIVIQEINHLVSRQVRLLTKNLNETVHDSSCTKTWLWDSEHGRFIEQTNPIHIIKDDPDFFYGSYLPTPQVKNKRQAWKTYYAIAHIMDTYSSSIETERISKFVEHILKHFSIRQ